jgi:Ca2+-binding RTX toxin-like protein
MITDTTTDIVLGHRDEGTDTLTNIEQLEFAGTSYTYLYNAAANTTITQNNTILAHDSFLGNATTIEVTGDQNAVFAGTGDTSITIFGNDSLLVGGQGDDILTATGTSNALRGGDGADILNGNASTATIFYFDMQDTIDAAGDALSRGIYDDSSTLNPTFGDANNLTTSTIQDLYNLDFTNSTANNITFFSNFLEQNLINPAQFLTLFTDDSDTITLSAATGYTSFVVQGPSHEPGYTAYATTNTGSLDTFVIHIADTSTVII